MSDIPTVVVSGFGRCGTSMVMQMLHAGGFQCIGHFPDYEVEQAKNPSAEFIASCAGRAVKVLDPQRVGLPGDVRLIWLKRDEQQQADSHAKFLSILAGIHLSRKERRSLAKQFTDDFTSARRVVGKRPWLLLRFEDTLSDPTHAAQQLATFLAPVGALDVPTAAAAVYPRGPACQPDLAIELALVETTSC
jgi:hypothetical protein